MELSVNTAPWVKREVFEPILPNTVRIATQPNPYRCEMGGTTPTECAIKCAEAMEKIIVLGDYNDDVDETVANGVLPAISSYISLSIL